MGIRNLFITSAVICAGWLLPGAASADYVCGTSWRPSSNTTLYGTEGYMSLSIYTGKDCSGTQVATYWLCTTGAAATNCSANHRYDRQTLIAAYQAALDALINNTRVYVAPSTCNGGASGCGGYLNFWAD